MAAAQKAARSLAMQALFAPKAARGSLMHSKSSRAALAASTSVKRAFVEFAIAFATELATYLAVDEEEGNASLCRMDYP